MLVDLSTADVMVITDVAVGAMVVDNAKIKISILLIGNMILK